MPLPSRIPGGIVGELYNQPIVVGTSFWRGWALVSGDVPGLKFAQNGTVTGIPIRDGKFPIVMSAVDPRGRRSSVKLLVIISAKIGMTPGVISPSTPSPLPLTKCGELASGTAYRLQNDFGAPSSTCLVLRGPDTRIDLDGHTVQGRIAGKAIDINGTLIENGSVTCDFGDSATEHGCIELSSESSVRAQVQLRDLTVRQLSTTADGASRALHVDWNAHSNALPQDVASVRLTGLNASVSRSTGHRSPVLGVQGSGITVEVDHNMLTCPTGANACQGIVCYGVHACWVHGNRILLGPNPHVEETARAILFDEMKQRPTDFGEAWNNEIVANEGRAIRIRSSYNIWVHDNWIRAVQNSGSQEYVAAIHLGDPDSGTDDLKDTRVFQNTFEVSNGAEVVFARNLRDADVEQNTVICKRPCEDVGFASIRKPLEAQDLSDLTLRNNTAVGLVLNSDVEPGAVLNLCKSGTATGDGKINLSSECKALSR